MTNEGSPEPDGPESGEGAAGPGEDSPEPGAGRRFGRIPLTRRNGLAAIAGLGVIGLGTYFGVSSCSDSPAPVALPKPKPKPKPTPKPSPKPPPPLGNPLTDIGIAGHVIAVKIDNVGESQFQHAGLNSADLVYVIQVEGGLSRYLAVFDSNHAPRSVGPVRSARQTDIQLLAAFGRVGLVFSGAILGLYKYLGRANLQNINALNASQLFSNGGNSPTYISPAEVFRTYPKLAQAQDVGLRFGPIPPGGRPARSVSVAMPSASFTFDASGPHWLVSCDGSPAMTIDQGRAYADNVIIQHVNVVHGKFTDYNAAQPANEVFSETTGHGAAEFYRDGFVWHGQWSKPTDQSPTAYTVNGKPFQLQPGRTWIVLLGNGYEG